jgi:hypothetical protein
LVGFFQYEVLSTAFLEFLEHSEKILRIKQVLISIGISKWLNSVKKDPEIPLLKFLEFQEKFK